MPPWSPKRPTRALQRGSFRRRPAGSWSTPRRHAGSRAISARTRGSRGRHRASRPSVSTSACSHPASRPACTTGEDEQEDFLVLSGECLLLVEGEERRLGQWDFVHCPAWTEHVFVGAGDGPCVVLMVGARPDVEVVYPVSEVALRHGAGVERETRSPGEAYAAFPDSVRGRPEGLALPWDS